MIIRKKIVSSANILVLYGTHMKQSVLNLNMEFLEGVGGTGSICHIIFPQVYRKNVHLFQKFYLIYFSPL